MRRSALTMFAVCALAWSACGVETPHDPEPPPQQAPPADALEARLRERGNEIAAFMMPHEAVKRGEMEERGARDFSEVMHAGWCYKIVAVADGITDLDLRLFDPNDVLLQRDVTQDDQPFLGRERPICPVEAGNYRIEVRARTGGGQFALQVYRSL
jgi:hypothetical protein